MADSSDSVSVDMEGVSLVGKAQAVNKRRRKRFRVNECYNSKEWKSLLPISAVPGSSLVLSGHSIRPILGPLFLNPIPSTRHTLFSSRSLLPPFPPIRTLSLPPLQPSDFDPIHDLRHETTSATFAHNRLESLRCPGPANTSLLFFPTGENSDRVGFLVLSAGAVGDVSSAGCGSLNHRILRIQVNPVAGCDSTIGYLLASSVYSVHWFAVVAKPGNTPSLVYLGSKVFKGSSVVGACWSPHLPEESLVLLESGELFLFDSEPWLRPDNENPKRKGTRLKVSWEDDNHHDGDAEWLSCEFSWHPRIVVLARSDAVFLVDLRRSNGHRQPSCLVKMETLKRLYRQVRTERFLAMATAGPDHFHFALVSNSLLVLVDVRKPLTPVLQWVHSLPDPSCVSVFGLADLRPDNDDSCKRASESGLCIVLGSFWNSEFKVFPYGPTLESPAEPRLCAWGLPSKLSLSGDECNCGSCLLEEEVLKKSLQPGLEWQRKKKIVLGFSVTRRERNGFSLVRLLSSGEVESQRYSASWQAQKKVGESHGTCYPRFNHHLMRCRRKYRLGRKLTYLELGYLRSHLDKALRSKLGNEDELESDESLTQELHESLCRNRNPPRVPLSAHEVALTRMWASVHTGLLQLAFSCNPESMGEPIRSLGYLGVSDSGQLPPFLLRNPKKGHYTDALTGAVIPLPVVRSLGETSGRFSFEEEYRLRTDEAVKTTRQAAAASAEPAVCLSDDLDQTPDASSQTVKRKFVLHKPNAFRSESGNNEEELFGTMVSKLVDEDNDKNGNENKRASVGLELFDSLCPIQMEFSGDATEFSATKLKFLSSFKRQYSNWQREFDLYKDFCSNSLT